MNIKKCTILLLSGLVFSQLRAQVTAYIPNVIPPSPNASTLTKFSDVPVSPYTGTADISVPIFTIQAKGLSIPIDLAYHTGGIRLSEESGWVGLGWALNAGGMISRTINDKDDFGGMYTTDVPQPAGDLGAWQPANGPPYAIGQTCPSCPPININKYIFDFNCSYDVRFNTSGADSVSNFAQPFTSSANSPYDLEPDSYSYNFPGKSGKFIITRTHQVIMEKQDNIRIQLLNPSGSIYYFLITDEKGNKFYFNMLEHGGLASNPSTLSTWHLSKILTQQNDSVKFNYVIPTGNPSNSVASTQTQTYTISCSSSGLNTSSNSGYVYDNVILQNIDYADGQVQFTFDNSRQDLQGGTKLNKIAIYSKNTAIGNNLTYIKEHDFFYTYFNAGTGADSLEMERLRLDSVKEVSAGVPLKPYSFIYNSAAPYPEGAKHSFSIDHWGYYNGQGNTVLVPSIMTSYLLNNVTSYFNYTGAIRDPSFPNMEAFSLQKVTYPTGGSSVLTYAANTYDYNKSQISGQIAENPYLTLSTVDTAINIPSSLFPGSTTTVTGNINFTNIYPLIAPGQPGTNATITISFISNYSTGWPPADRVPYNKLSVTFNGGITDLSYSGLTCSGPACSVSYNLAIPSAANYPFSVYWDKTVIPPADFSEVSITVSYQGFTPYVNSNPTLTAGGLRVSSIVDYNLDGTIAKQRTWDYGYGSSDQYSNGKLMAFPSYVHSELVTYGTGQCLNFVLFSNSNSALTSTIGGNIVGYSQVAEYTVNPSGGVDNGKVVYNFVNTPDTTIYYGGLRLPGIPNMGNNLNGELLSKITYKDIGSGVYWKVKEADSYYHTTNKSVYYSSKYQSSAFAGNPSGYCPGGTPVPNQGIAEFFPSIKSERVLEDSTYNIVYDQNDTTKYVTTVNKSFYDNPLNYLLTRSKLTDSKGNIHVSKQTYPQDYIVSGGLTNNAILDSLIGRNMVAETIEKRDSLYYAGNPTGYVTGASESRYRQLSANSNPMVLDKLYKLDIVGPVTNFVPMSVSGNTYNQDSRYRQLISFDTYDGSNNISQYTLLYQPSVSILWDYRAVSPIAQVKGAAQTDIAYTSFEAQGTGNWTVGSSARDSVTVALTGTKSYNLALGNISKSGLTSATTYVVSYWTKNSSPLTITGTITGYPVKGFTNSNGWTYYEHKVTGQTTITLSGTGNIDEVRLYPQSAEMTSYTYNPLTGVSSINDARAGINFFEYDGFQRLVNIKDQYGNIVKNYTYHYYGQ